MPPSWRQARVERNAQAVFVVVDSADAERMGLEMADSAPRGGRKSA